LPSAKYWSSRAGWEEREWLTGQKNVSALCLDKEEYQSAFRSALIGVDKLNPSSVFYY
jgi:hypothetical protein